MDPEVKDKPQGALYQLSYPSRLEFSGLLKIVVAFKFARQTENETDRWKREKREKKTRTLRSNHVLLQVQASCRGKTTGLSYPFLDH